MRLPLSLGIVIIFAATVVGIAATRLSLQSSRKVGSVVGSTTLVATGQEVELPPETLTYAARPVDMVVTKDGRFAYVKDTSGLTVIDLKSPKIVGQTPVKGGQSLTGLALSPDEKLLAYSDAGNGIEFFQVNGGDVKLVWSHHFSVPKAGGEAYPCGLAFSADGRRLYAAINRSNQIGVIDVKSHELTAVYPVDIAPVGVALADESHLLVTCWAAKPDGNVPTANSSGTQVPVDKRGIGTGGTLCELDLTTGMVSRRLDIGLQASEVVVKNNHAFVAASNSDQVFDVELASWTSTPQTPLAQMRAGSAPSSVALAGDELYMACAGRNTVLRKNSRSGLLQETRTPWYPIAVRSAGSQIVVACNEGLGMRTKSSTHPGWNSYDFQGSITILGPRTRWFAPDKDPVESRQPRQDATPSPVPLNTGEPSAIQHVVYILKENRTYDQVLGDIGKGDSDPSLTIYGKVVTPNHHALANEFVLLDNYYCNGVLSADGHAWAMEGNATSYFQRSFGGWTRSYPYGDDPLSVTRSGFIWDDLLDHGKSVWNYGEFDYATPTPNVGYAKILQDFESGTNAIGFKQNIGVARLRALSQPGYPGWNLEIPDVVRARLFIKDLARMEREGSMPNFVIVYLPQDHTSGGSAGAPTARAQVADNDLAVGRVVEAVSKSKFWAHTAIFVNEDDPQAGFDHVDGHRSFCLVVSPYARRHTVVSEFYNQTSVLRTVEHMLGVPAMNRFDAESPLMSDCFQSTADLRPFSALPNQIPLDEMTPTKPKTVSFRLDKPDMVDENAMNRSLWREARGSQPYPSQFAGAHGLGLAKRGLRLDPHGMEEGER